MESPKVQKVSHWLSKIDFQGDVLVFEGVVDPFLKAFLFGSRLNFETSPSF